MDLNRPAPKLVYEADEDFNTLFIKFDQIILLPNNIRNYTSENMGSEVFQIDYFPSDSSMEYRYENEIDVRMAWKVK